MSRPPDYYAILGVARNADDRDVKRAWRSAARNLHPDLPANKGNAHALRRFQLVKEAYDVLSDEERRKDYDAGRTPYMRVTAGWTDGDPGPSQRSSESADDIELQTDAGEGVADIFASLFSGGAASNQAPKTDSLWDPERLNRDGHATRGADSPERSSANGWRPQDDPRAAAQGPGPAADSSGGGGWRPEYDPNNADRKRRWGFDPEDLAEAALKGDMAEADGMFGGGPDLGDERDPWQQPGERRNTPRSEASTRGEELSISVQVPFRTAALGGPHRTTYRVPDAAGNWSVEELVLALPAGFDDGGELRIAARGNLSANGGPRGDLLVSVFVEDDPIFSRRGADVLVDLPLSPWEAAAGTQLQVPTLQGSNRVRVPPGVKSGQKLRLRGLGLIGADGRRGSQELVIQIQLPPGLSAEGLELLKRLDVISAWSPRATWARESDEG